MSTIDIYSNTKLKENKNFVISDIDAYLLQFTHSMKIDFQYQRITLYKAIKVDMGEQYATQVSGINKYDYMVISQTESNNQTAKYYYFITGAKQVAKSTIEFQLKMDVLNTFQYSSSITNKSYTLSPKTLVEREHKDRFYIHNERTFSSSLKFNLQPDIEYWLNEDQLTFPFTLTDDGYWPSALLGVYNEENEVIEFTGIWGANPLIFDVSDDPDYKYKITYYRNPAPGVPVDLYIPDGYHVVFKFNGEYISYWDLNSWYRTSDIFLMLRYTYGRNRAIRIVDKYNENIPTYLFKKKEIPLYDPKDGYNSWYLIYSSTNAVVSSSSDTEPIYDNPVQVCFASDQGYSVDTTSASQVVVYPESIPQYTNEEEWLFIKADMFETGGWMKVNGVTYSKSDIGTNYPNGVSIQKKNNNDAVFTSFRNSLGGGGTQIASNFGSVTFYGINQCELYTMVNGGLLNTPVYKGAFPINAGTSTTTFVAPKFSEFDLTDPKLIKIFKLPYSPVDYIRGTEIDGIPDFLAKATNYNLLQLSKAQNNNFDYQIQFVENPWTNLWFSYGTLAIKQARDVIYESKLYHSDFFQEKFVYDSFTFTFMYENVDMALLTAENYDVFNVRYVTSGNVLSKFLFQFPQYYCTDRETQDYNNVLIVERNNEKALYTNAYLNYIRSGGYNYDSKKAETRNNMNAMASALCIAGAIVSFAAAPTTGGATAFAGVSLLTAGVSSVVNTLNTAQEQDRAINQKLLQTSQQSTSVLGSEDIDLFTAISDNKAMLVEYSTSEIMTDALWNLFHYFGYATHEYKVPSVTSRLYFNYVCADIVFKEYRFNDDIAEEIKSKWKQGVTFFHKVMDGTTATWDIEQEYENFETSVL